MDSSRLLDKNLDAINSWSAHVLNKIFRDDCKSLYGAMSHVNNVESIRRATADIGIEASKRLAEEKMSASDSS